MAPPQVYQRLFSRTTQNDSDVPVTEDFVKQNLKDIFGQLLADGSIVSILRYRELAEWFWARTTNSYTFATFAVADGAFVPAGLGYNGWFSNHVRFLTVITPKENPNEGKAPPNVFVVGSLPPDGTDGFLQVASWDGEVMRFYAVEEKDGVEDAPRIWTYQGNSWDAFNDGPTTAMTEYLGPFNGHVNGACIMKELHKPWYHWYTGSDGNFTNCLTQAQKDLYKSIPFLTASGSSVFMGSSVKSAEQLEPIVTRLVADWYNNRAHSDFYDKAIDGGKHKLREKPVNIRRWMAHLLLTTTINISTALDQGDDIYALDWNHFFNLEMLSKVKSSLIPTQINSNPLKFSFDKYNAAVKRLQLGLVCEDAKKSPLPSFKLPKGTLGGGRQTGGYDTVDFVEVRANTEDVPFVILQPSYEDSIGVLRLQNIKSSPLGLLSSKAFRSVVMLDYWNPVFSWRRGVLMQYVPASTALVGQKYDLEDKWVDAIRQSEHVISGDTTSPEYQFIQLYDNDKGDPHLYDKRLNKYISKIRDKMKTEDGIYEYLQLAESRRRIYRPLPLDEFGVQLPYARALDDKWSFVEMKEDGATEQIPTRGMQFLSKWTDSLASFDPHLIPAVESNGKPSTPESAPADIPMASGMSRCPVMSSRARKAVEISAATNEVISIPPNPTWDDDVRVLFEEPSWAAEGTGQIWREAMLEYSPPRGQPFNLDISEKDSVQESAVTIYQHLRSRSMPITQDASEYWPDWALETFRLWANQGYRTTASDPVNHTEVISSTDPPFTMRVRKDILSLSDLELQTYREKLDTILRVGVLFEEDGKTPSKWQELGLLHAEWCLHYQEATFLWHRAFLRYVEELIDFPIPYWDGFAADTSDPESPYAGIPQIFLDDKYTDSKGEVRNNPLRWAQALNGKNKLGTGPYVERAPELVDGRGSAAWTRKVSLFKIYHKQINDALQQPQYSLPEAEGLPWANIPVFTDNMPDTDYPVFAKKMYFDGLFEQAHDNYHGWVGADMADNSFTAFDPIFLSYHCNMDRIVERFLRSQGPQTMTINFPLRPFINGARDLSYADPREYIYTTIGDMQKDTKALNYMFAPPFLPDFVQLPKPSGKLAPKGGQAVPMVPKTVAKEEALWTVSNAHSDKADEKPFVIFSGVNCTKDSYEIDVFVKGAQNLSPDPVINADFIGRITRLGMGSGRDATKPIKNAGRCEKHPITRILKAEDAIAGLKREQGIKQVVRDLATGQEVDESEWKNWPGFVGRLVWG